MKKILFVCVENSNRSQMAEAFARMHGAGKVEAMQELGYDLTAHTSKGLDDFNGKEIEIAVTMGCGDECPLVRAGSRVDWQIPDPREMSPEQFREVRDLIERKVKELIATL